MKAKNKRKPAIKAKARPVPAGFRTLTPHLVVREANRAIEFYKQAFGAKVKGVHYMPDGKVMHASLRIGDSALMMSDEFPFGPCVSPQTVGKSTVTIHIYVKDVDKLYNQAVAAGAKAAMPLMDAFWGDRYGQLEDPFGHRWSLATHIKDLSEKEIEKAGQEAMAKMAPPAPGN